MMGFILLSLLFLAFALALGRAALMETSKAFLQAQSIFHPPTFIVAAILPLHTALAYFLVHRTPLRENGVAISVAMSYTLIGVLLVGWIARTEARECWGGWSRRCLEGWRAYLGILVPSAMVSRSVLFIVCLSTPRYRRRFSDGKRWKVRSRRRRLIRMIAFVSLGDCV
jgi:Na+-driven multidrug efflux pump